MSGEQLKAQAIARIAGKDPSGRKRIALDLLYATECGDNATTARLTTDDFQFQFMRRMDSWVPAEGKQTSRLDKQPFLENGITMVNDLTENGMFFNIERIVEEDDTVAIFGESNGVAKTGAIYNNRYCWRFSFVDDRISELLEFCDTEHAVTTFFS